MDANRTARALNNMLHILQHTIGADRYGHRSGDRNHFVAGSAGTDLEKCLAAVALGYMREYTNEVSPALIGGGQQRLFLVTRAGISFVNSSSDKRPKLSRSQARWQRYRHYSECFESFREFLRWDGEKERSWNGG